MANLEAGTSSVVARTSRGVYQVFLSFRGPDTRHGFTDFLYHNLVDVGVRVFRDDDELRVGEVIGKNLLSAINNSIIYIPIFSRTYASSKWCLWELAHIVDTVSKSEDEKSILPVFFDVEPDDVKLKTSIYSKALSEHEKKFHNEVEAWRVALAKVGGIKGWNVKSSQAEIVKSIVEKVLEKLKIKQKLVTENLVGLDDRIKYLIELLDVNSYDVRLIAIYGMGGIGKTTIAKVIFNQLSSHFGKCCSFLEDVRESLLTKEAMVELQKKLLFDIVGSRSVEQIKDSEEGMLRIGVTLSTKKVLVVLDDIDNKEHIKKLIGNSTLHSGSRIIITSRNIAVMHVEEFEGKILNYEMLKMDNGPALELFYQHAFHGDFPLDGYRRLSRQIVSSTGGLPLAIEVMGSLLHGKDQEIWEETLEKLKKVPEKKILDKLRISYDDLDEHHKQIFLDIACFLFNENKTDAMYMWTNCQFYPKGGIKVLIDRCLVKILDNDMFWMHDQLISLGRQIVCEESPNDPDKRSRLWNAEEALQIMATKERKDKVQGLEIRQPFEITNEEFEGLPKLRFLNLHKGTFVGDFTRCRSKLRWFSWHCPLEKDFRADNFYLDQLVICKLHRIDFKDDSKAWDLIKRAHNLKVLSITFCNGITTIPNISRCLALERLILAKCSGLKRIESFIGDLQSLIELEIKQCNITDLPKEVGALVKLKHFSLFGCQSLRKLPDSIGNLTSLTKLDLSGTIIRELPNSIGKLKSLRVFHFLPINGLDYREAHREAHDWQLPSSFGLVNLEELNLSGHYKLTGEIPIGIGESSSLRILNLMGTRISRIPRTINMLHHLQTLNLTECHKIQELPELPASLTTLLLESYSLLSVPKLSNLTNLVELQLSKGYLMRNESNKISGCNIWGVGRLFRLQKLAIILPNVPAPPELAFISHLEELTLARLDLESFVHLPSSLRRLNLEFFNIRWAELLPSRLRLGNLSTLEFCDVEVEDIPLDGLPQLENLTIKRCELLQRLSLELRELQEVHVSSCPELAEIQFVGLSRSLRSFTVIYCISLRRLGGLSYLKNLKILTINWCTVLSNVEGLHELKSLNFLEVTQCPSLRRSNRLNASTNIPTHCHIKIKDCDDFIKDFTFGYSRSSLKRHREKNFLHASHLKSKFAKISFTIRFHLGVKKSSDGFGFVGGVERDKENVTPNSVTYEGLVADVKNFGVRLKRIWYETPCVYNDLLIEIKSDEQVKGVVQLASTRGLIYLYVEGGVDSEWEGEYDEKMMGMLKEEWRMKSDVNSDDDEAKWDVSHPDEDLDSASSCESGSHGTFYVDDFQSELGNIEYYEAT